MLGIRKFQRKKENFICFNCGAKVKGDGYTDHCPYCLWSVHVDNNPGDRLSCCLGKMEPIGAELKSGERIINYLCLKCGLKHRVRCSEKDNFEEILKLFGKN